MDGRALKPWGGVIEAQASRTALRVALRRAAHQVHDARPLVFDDLLAVRILGPEYAEELARTPDKDQRPFSAALRAFVVARARLAEDALAAAHRDDRVRQYLLLGAGLDTFAYRNPYADVRVFEVDHPATQAWKRERLAAAALGVPESVRFVAVDFERMSIRDELDAAGFDFAVPTMTAWLGVVPYLTREAFRATGMLLGSFGGRSGVVFDYALPRAALPPREKLMRDSLADRVRLAGEPFRLFFMPEELRGELAAAGLRVVEDLDGPAMTARLFAGRNDGLKLRGKGGHVCRAVTAG
ncbi:MAG: class I SAM-dependent methyltransferase [Acidobacteriota bacterium]|nr:class I SAM-dependent methyltransferase [Acidobacteriota bacterium]